MTAIERVRAYLRRRPGQIGTLPCWFVVAMLLPTTSAYAALNGLTSVKLNEAATATELLFEFTAEPPVARSFMLERPNRLVLDFPGTLNNVGQSYLPYAIGLIGGVQLVEGGDRTRAVISLTGPVSYETLRRGGNVIALTLAPFGKAATGSAPSARSIENIDFRRGDKGQGLVEIRLTDPQTIVDVNRTGEQVVVEVRETKVPERLERLLDVIDFATPVRTVDAMLRGNDTRIVITSAGDYVQSAYQTNELFTVEIAEPPPPDKAEIPSAEGEKEYTGERLSLNFQNIETRAILQIIADFTGLNIVVSDTVTGNLTLRLKQVPWDHALDIILKTQGLAMRRKDNVILVAPSEEIAAREKLELESKQQIQELAPLVTEIIRLRYASAGDIEKLLSGNAGGGDAAGGDAAAAGEAAATATADTAANTGGLLSARGTAKADERTNSILIQDTEDRLNQIKAVLDQLDIPIRQVMIESRIVIASDTFSKDLGVQFGLGYDHYDPTTNFFTAAGGSVGAGRTWNPVETAAGFNSGTAGQEQFLVDLPVAAATSGIGLAIGSVGKYLLRLELTAAQIDGRSETVASPRVVTADRAPAKISQGIEIPYQSVEGTGANATVSIEFKEAVLELNVTPQITPDNRVIMEIALKKQDPDDTTIPGQIAIATREITSTVLVDNDETLVLGGVYERSLSHAVNKVPFFGDLPVVGNLFKRTAQSDSKNELLVFITPEIIDKIDLARK
ncbi:MAG: type IV pilus secretin PilQ [Gammaproteobacteria bacterium]|nr:type IV pilus secretin PilQ [Gammaproteobacteria bacterium]MCP5138197.1 type IV pilus secretin PilQ [Gammaproteobacteria bacterium]